VLPPQKQSTDFILPLEVGVSRWDNRLNYRKGWVDLNLNALFLAFWKIYKAIVAEVHGHLWATVSFFCPLTRRHKHFVQLNDIIIKNNYISPELNHKYIFLDIIVFR